MSFTLPTSLPVASRQDLLEMEALVTPKGPFLISWQVFPEWTEALEPVLSGDLGEAVPYGSLLLAHTCLNLMHGLRGYRPDLGHLHRLYPHLGELLAGHRQLPALPAEPPAAFVRVGLRNRGSE